MNPEAVLALVDDTGSDNHAKDGGILTDTHLYAHNMWEKAVSIELSAVETVSVGEGDSMLVNEARFLDFAYADKGAMRLFARMVEEIVFELNPEAKRTPDTESVKPAADALKELKELFDAGIITEEEYRDKREKYVDQL